MPDEHGQFKPLLSHKKNLSACGFSANREAYFLLILRSFHGYD